jgi:hypothetical protein
MRVFDLDSSLIEIRKRKPGSERVQIPSPAHFFDDQETT